MTTIDSHQHFWQLNRGDYGWLTPELTSLYKDYLPADLLHVSKGLNVSNTVLVQAAATNEETDFMLQLADSNEFILGVVGWIDFEANTEEVCQRLEILASNPKFKGVRPMLQDIDDTDWILTPEFAPIFKQLIKLNLTFDALVFTKHLANIETIANTYPELKIVIDHCAKPNIAQGELASWAEAIERFAELSNVYIKVSGLPTEASKQQQASIDFEPYFEHVHQVFGANRMMWGSDWPVVNINSDYASWLTVSKGLTANWTAEDKEYLYQSTVTRFYNLSV